MNARERWLTWLPVLVAAGAMSACQTGPGPSRPTALRDMLGTSGDIVGPERFAEPPLPIPSDLRTADGRPGPGYWQNQADYTIDASLDESVPRVTGHEVVRYTNNSPLALEHIWLNLEQNLYRPDSDGARITKPNTRFGSMSFSGGVELGAVRVGGQDAKVNVYGTVARIDLPAGTTLAARGGSSQVEVDWSFKVPEHGSDRMGIFKARDGQVFQIAQWYPQVCKYDDVHGWNTLPYLGQGEFYSDFGDFDVRLTVPRTHIVAACGELINPEEVLTAREQERLKGAWGDAKTVNIRSLDEVTDAGSRLAGDGGRETLTWKFKAKSVRSFAWASSAAFIWDAAAASGTTEAQIGTLGSHPGTVLCQAFYPREAAELWKPEGAGGGAVQMLKASIESYSVKWFAFPYGAASNVNGTVGGMEYPGFIFCKEHEQERGLWGVTTHEIGHSWFPMIVNSDERRHAWMDEGFNSFINHYATLERYGKIRDWGDPKRRMQPRVWGESNADLTAQPIETPADLIAPGLLGRLEYGKTAMGLLVLREAVLGPERFDRAFREYVRRWAFKSPQPADFFRTMEDLSGMNLGWFWRGWFFGTGVVDQAVTTVMQTTSEGGDARITFKNLGSVIMPVWYRVEYTDGTTEDRALPVYAWGWSDSFEAGFNTKGRQIKSVTIDPEERLPDVDRRNNVWTR